MKPTTQPQTTESKEVLHTPETIRLLAIVQTEFQKYVDIVWKHHKEPVVKNYNDMQNLLDYTLPQITTNYQRLLEINRELLDVCKSCLTSLKQFSKDATVEGMIYILEPAIEKAKNLQS